MKQETKLVAIVLAILIVFLSGFALGATKGITVNVNGGGVASDAGAAQAAPAPAETTTAAPAPAETTTAAPAPAETTTAAPAADAETTAAPAADAGASAGAVPATPAECVAAYNKAVNDLKAFTGNVTIQRIENIDVGVDSCSAAALTSTLDSIVRKFITSSDETTVFVNGVQTSWKSNTSGETYGEDANTKVTNKIYPHGRNVEVTEADIASATAAAAGDGFKVTIKFPEEVSTYDGTTSTDPVKHMKAMDPLNLASLSLDPIKITSANMTYPGATCDATVDGSGKLTELKINLPLKGTGTGGMGFISAEVGVSGAMDTTFVVTYQ